MAKTSNKKPEDKRTPEAKPSPAKARPTIDLGAELFSWSLIPFQHQKKRGAIFLIATFAFAGLVWWASSLVYALVALAISFGASASFIFPTTYRLCENGVEIRNLANTTTRKWSMFQKYYVVDDGFLLAYYPRRKREKGARGLFFYFGDIDRERVINILDSNIDQP
ncbi:MAG: hypothetical protein ACOX2K_09720 [Bacillota bacterium]